MNLMDYTILVIIFACIASAITFILRRKKKGGCIGCSSCCGSSSCKGCSDKSRSDGKELLSENTRSRRKLS